MFLHQTTTPLSASQLGGRCILSCSYIKPQLCLTFILYSESCILSCSYIKPQPNPRKLIIIHGCILSCSYIKPQHSVYVLPCATVVYYHVPTSNHNYRLLWRFSDSLYIIMFLHQTTTVVTNNVAVGSCILSCSYIKPQLVKSLCCLCWVVYYHVPTSNHNCTPFIIWNQRVVYYHVPTSNHNL